MVDIFLAWKTTSNCTKKFLKDLVSQDISQNNEVQVSCDIEEEVQDDILDLPIFHFGKHKF
jgi:hypothetical protein